MRREIGRWMGLLTAGTLFLAGPAGAIEVSVAGPGQPDVPAEHVVEQGDTLWSICEEFFDEGWQWPGVWALNPHITNPHWIYPGDVVRLRNADGTPISLSEVVVPTAYTVGVNNAAQINLNEGFITEEDMKAVGTLTHSVEAKRMLGAGDAVYLEFDKLDEVRIGQQYSIYKLLNDVVHPQSEEILGQKVQVLGIAEIDTVEEHVARARIVRSFTEIERGARLVPLLNHYQVVAPKQNLLDLTGMIVDSFREVQELGQFHVAFVDKGSKDGVQVGNRLFVMRRGDGREVLEEDALERLPWEQVGELLVVETHDRNSTVLITRSAKELKVGDRVQMERNY
ncbi:LysM peptidoglycan-binding domain-containing protein [Myxococcota bacterium]|nr:LysM peptidoglycan-binding domain-containing protein [Myxococcota bacterium]